MMMEFLQLVHEFSDNFNFRVFVSVKPFSGHRCL